MSKGLHNPRQSGASRVRPVPASVERIVPGGRPLSGKARGVQVVGSTLTVIFVKSRRFCATCMVRKSNWVFVLGEFLKVRVCASCMTPAMRAALRGSW